VTHIRPFFETRRVSVMFVPRVLTQERNGIHLFFASGLLECVESD